MQPIEKAWVFGSCSRGEETKDSDIDILVRFDSHARITLFKYAGMVEALSQLLHRKVDLVEEGQLKDFAVSSVFFRRFLESSYPPFGLANRLIVVEQRLGVVVRPKLQRNKNRQSTIC